MSFDNYSLDDMGINDFEDEVEEPSNKSPVSDFENEEDYDGYYSETTFGNASILPLTEEANQLRENKQLENKFNDIFSFNETEEEKAVHEEDVKYFTEKNKEKVTEQIENEKKIRKLFVNDMEWCLEQAKEGVSNLKNISSEKKKVREYKKEAVMPKAVYAKPLENKGGIKKILLFLLVCSAVGAFMGIKANSYYIYENGEVNSAMSCVFGWLTVEGMPYTFLPLYWDIFLEAFFFGFGILGIIGLFIWLDNDAKKNSRVGHEHGKARLGSSKDFKTFKNKFMEK